MALPAAPGSPAIPSQFPVVGGAGPPGSPPAGGAGGATMPTPNHGMQAQATGFLTAAIRILEKALPLFGSVSDEGKEVMKALTALSKIAPPGSGSPGVENSAMHNLMAQQKQESPLLQLLRQKGMNPSGQGGAAPPGTGAGAPPPSAAA